MWLLEPDQISQTQSALVYVVLEPDQISQTQSALVYVVIGTRPNFPYTKCVSICGYWNQTKFPKHKVR